MDLTEKKLSGKCIYDSGFMKIYEDEVELPNGHKSVRSYVSHNGGVCIAAIDSEGRVAVVKQYRYALNSVITELPAGKIDPGETPEECGRRELMEEAGVVAEKFTPLGVMYPSPGYTGENIYMFLAENLSCGKENPDEDEFLEHEWVPFDKFLEKCLSGSVNDAKTVVCIARAQNILQRKNK